FHESDLVIGLWDQYPVSPGHALLIPRRHIAGWFDATPEEQQALTSALAQARSAIEESHQPDGYNIGINSGEAAGQTVHHLHVHLIPRYQGDSDDPRGGVRHVIPGKADYWTKSE
ncbi:MAG: HIT family protein, partial [Spiribacter salinus]